MRDISPFYDQSALDKMQVNQKQGWQLSEALHQIFKINKSCKPTIPLVLIAIFLAIPLGVSASTVSFAPSSVLTHEGETADISLMIDDLPNGLAGYGFTVEVSNQEVAEITQVSFPAWASLNDATDVPSGFVRMSAVDMNLEVKPGSSDIILCTISVSGKSAGYATITLQDIQIDTHNGDLLETTVNSGSIIVNEYSTSNEGEYDGNGESNWLSRTITPTQTMTTSLGTVSHTNPSIETSNFTDTSNTQQTNSESEVVTSKLTVVQTLPTPENTANIPGKSLPLSVWTIIVAIMTGAGAMCLYSTKNRKR